LIAKLHTLSSELSFLRELEESDIAFFAADTPQAHRNALKKMITDAEAMERVLRRPLYRPANASRRGIRLRAYRDPQNGELGRRQAAQRARKQAMQLKPVIDELRGQGLTSLSAIARELSARQIPTSAGAQTWSASLVGRVIKRINAVSSSEPEPPPCGSL
jgi:hypothetical protein